MKKRFYEGGMDEKEPGWETKEAPAVSAPKPRIVTKEELAKSGLSLRDFLNKERGLTRRGESTPPAVEAEKTTTTVSAPATSATATSAPVAPKKDTYRTLSGEIKTKKTAAERDAEMAARRASTMEAIGNIGSGIGNMISKAQQNYESTRPVSRQVQKEREQAMSRGNLAKGGKVSSASARADGIAQRGKTKGTMIMCGGGYAKGKK